MYTCDHCWDRIWEEVFGLLEVSESESLRRHVAVCSACQAEMATAVAQHRLVAEAVRLDVEIPPFTAPVVDGTQPVFRPPGSEATAVVRRRIRVMSWLAAAVLLVIGLPLGFFQHGRLRYEAAWRAAEESVAQIVKEREEFRSQAQLDRENLVRAALANHLRLQVVGPAAYQIGAVSPYRVWVTDVEGHLVDAPVTARLLDAGKPLVVETRKSANKGEWLVELPANLAVARESTPCLELVVQGQDDLAPVRAYLPVLDPAYRTHLTTDKPLYHTGDSIFFRSLTLERFGLKVPDREFTAIYTLSDVRGKEFQTLRGLTRTDGIGGGAFALSPNWPAGEYALTVAEAENRFPAVTHRFWVWPAASTRSGTGGQFRFGQSEKPAHTIPAMPDKLEVDFFPEGGDLVAGLDNHVYFRVRTPLGQPADLQGAIIDSLDREVVAVNTARPGGQPALNRGLGQFTLRPQAGEMYKLRVLSPRGVDIRAPLPAVQTTGLALSLPAAVGGPDEPIRALLRQTGPERNLVVGLFCQGRLVAQELVAAKSGTTEVRLTPTVSSSGVLRVTVFEERQGQLRPLAERLTYRRPKGRLVLSVRADKKSYAPGEGVKLNIRSVNENGKPEPAWLLVSVVDQAALLRSTDAAETSLPAYFHLASELQKLVDLEQADILLGDSPEAATALDLFLGTQGWRRFAAQEAETALVMGNAGATRRAQDMAVPAIVKLDNLEQVEQKYATSLSQAFADLSIAVTKRDQELVREGGARLQVAQAAAQKLDAYATRAGEIIRLGAGLGGVVLFAAACLLLAIALLRLARGLAANRAYLAGACAALLTCALILCGPAGRWQATRLSTNVSESATYGEKLRKPLDLAAMPLPNNQGVAPSRVLSKRRGSFPQEASGKHLATLGSNEEADAAREMPRPGPGAPGRRPFIGSITGKGPDPEPPPPIPSYRHAPVRPLPIRVYAYAPPKEPVSSREPPDTILWQPILFAADGTAEANFTLPAKAATYRIQVQGNNATGRLGAIQEKVECRQMRPAP